MGNPIHLSGPIYKDVDDYTLYIPAIKGNKVFRLGKSTSSCDTSICINDNGHSACGRALACWCNNRQHVSAKARPGPIHPASLTIRNSKPRNGLTQHVSGSFSCSLDTVSGMTGS
jgi:hypothetical protein